MGSRLVVMIVFLFVRNLCVLNRMWCCICVCGVFFVFFGCKAVEHPLYRGYNIKRRIMYIMYSLVLWWGVRVEFVGLL